MAVITGSGSNDLLYGSGANDLITALAGDDTIDGGGGNDTIDGGDGDDIVTARGGNENMAGGNGYDELIYRFAAAAVNANLATGLASGGSGNDTIAGFELLEGSAFNDTLVGNSSNNDFVGGSGADSIDGGSGFDVVGYRGASAAVVVNLATGVVSGGAGADTLVGIEGVFGSSFNDTLTGGAGNEFFNGALGDDSITGGGGFDTIGFEEATSGVQVNLAAGTASGADGNDVFSGIEAVIGGDFADTLIGSAGDDLLDGRDGSDRLDGAAGNDTLYGGRGSDTLIGGLGNDSLFGDGNPDGGPYASGEFDNDIDVVDYSTAGAALTVNLTTGIATVASGGGTDTLAGFELVIGTAFADSMVGNSAENFFVGGAGNDTIEGGGVASGGGTDAVLYFDAPSAVNVNLSTGVVSGGGGNDVLIAITGVGGSQFNDTLTGGSADEGFAPGLGNDTISGGGGRDSLFYGQAVVQWASGGVNVNLATGLATGGAGNDSFSGIEDVNGSVFSDTLLGDGSANELDGDAGNDSLDGAGGNDTLQGGDGLDTLLGGQGNDTLQGDAGDDWLTGGSGADVYFGGTGNDVVFFEDAPAGANVNLLTGVIANDGYGNAETIFEVENLHGTQFADQLTLGNLASYVFARAGNDNIVGGNGNNNVYGGSGNDTINGGGGTDTANYFSDGFDPAGAPTQGVVVNLLTGVASDNWGGTDSLVNIENVAGSALADSLTGNAGANFFDGGAGNDSLFGGDGEDTLRGGAGDDLIDGGANVLSTTFDRADYGESSAAVNVNLTTGTATGSAIGTDTLVGIEGITGSAFDDTLVGAATPDLLNGGLGNDTIDGAGGFDIVNYGGATTAVVVNLALGTATGGFGNDTLISIEGVIGGAGNDSLTGTAGGDFLRGNGGNDTIDGGDGIDRAAYDFGPAGSTSVNVSLVTNTATGAGFGTDTLISIENLRGSNFNDVLEGDDGANNFEGRGGNDTLIGNGGNDSLFGEDGNDSLLGGAGADFVQGGAGNDTMDGGIVLDIVNLDDSNSLSWSTSTAAVTVNTATGSASDGFGGTDTFTNFSVYTGSAHNDSFSGTGGGGFEHFEGGLGNDTINGGAILDPHFSDSNRATYQNASGAVTVNLATGSATGAAGSDTLININHVRGSAFQDVLTGSGRTDVTEVFEGRAGNDTIDGAGGLDQVRYAAAAAAVNVNLATGTASDGDGGTDSFTGIEAVRGSRFDDTLTGGNAANGVGAREGLEAFQGDGGNDFIDGGQGFDRIDFNNSPAGVTVIFTGAGSGTAQDGYGTVDTFVNIEGVRGSEWNDTLTGSDAAPFELFQGRTGNDVIDGRGGIDAADYSTSRGVVAVNLTSGAANDGEGGNDTLSNIEDLYGGRFDDTLFGNAVANELRGNDGNDNLAGFAGNDRLVGGAGNDTMRGDEGGDTFVFAVSGNGVDTIADWGAGDRVFIAGAQLSFVTSGNGSTVSNGGVEVGFSNGENDIWIDTDGAAGAEIHIRLQGAVLAPNSLFIRNDADGATIARVIDNPPLLATPLADRLASAGGAFALAMQPQTFVDPKGGSLTFSATLTSGAPLPAWLRINAISGTLVGAAGTNDVGLLDLRVRATDSGGASATDDVTLAIAPVGFNGLNYIASNADLRAAFGVDASAGTRHYVVTGRFENRSVTFDPMRYTAAYADLIGAFSTNGAAAAAHYIGSGANEGRNDRFDGRAYWAMNATARREAGTNLTALARHYIAGGYGSGAATTLDGLRYIASHGDLIGAFGANAAAGVAHFASNGFAEGRAATFNPLAYIASYTDLMGAFGVNAGAALQHYIANGYAEGRRVNFDPLRYTASYGDLISAFGTNETASASHFISTGYSEGRQAGFDARQYWAMNQAARADAGTDLSGLARHYITRGFGQGASAAIDGLRYVASYADLSAVFGSNAAAGTQHFLASGFAEGRAVTFDPWRYLASNADLMGAIGSNTIAATQHYINNGRAEARPLSSFDGWQYMLANADVRAAFASDADAATRHYVSVGRAEGRVAALASVVGTAGADVLIGNSTHQLMSGGAGDDYIRGFGGNDLLVGGAGNDVLTGGNGADVFSFGGVGDGVDAITDFSSGSDVLLFSSAGFAGLPQGRLDTSRFAASSAELGTRAGFVWDALTGSLAFDPDGAGGQAAVAVAGFGVGGFLVHTDIFVGP